MYSILQMKILERRVVKMKMSPFERKFGKYAISNLSFVLVMCYAVGYVLQMFGGQGILYGYLTLDPYAVLHGQVWRLFEYVLPDPAFKRQYLSNGHHAVFLLFHRHDAGTDMGNLPV